MEFLDGEDLAHMLETTGLLSIPDAVDYLLQACEAIAEAHALGIVHRDIKPANLFVTQGPDGSPTVKVLDFGISKTQDSALDKLTGTKAIVGSAYYMSPEQLTQPKSVDLRTDIYALGISLYELLAGRYPFDGITLAELHVRVCTGTPAPLRNVRADVPEALALVLQRAYARDRDHRYASIAELVMALAPFAPPRSRPTIERIARMGGVAPPPPSQPAATALTPPPSAPQPPPPPPQTPPLGIQQIVPGPYHGPMSTRAAANFAQGATAGVNLSTSRPMIKGSPNRAGALVLAVLATIAMIGIGGALALAIARRGPSIGGTAQPGATAPPSASASAQAKPPAPVETASASAPSAPEPPPPASASAAKPPDEAKPTAADRHDRKPGPGTKSAVAPTAQPAKDDGSLDLPPSVYGNPSKR